MKGCKYGLFVNFGQLPCFWISNIDKNDNKARLYHVKSSSALYFNDITAITTKNCRSYLPERIENSVLLSQNNQPGSNIGFCPWPELLTIKKVEIEGLDQCCGLGLRIGLDPCIRIRVEVKSCIRIRKETNADSQH